MDTINNTESELPKSESTIEKVVETKTLSSAAGSAKTATSRLPYYLLLALVGLLSLILLIGIILVLTGKLVSPGTPSPTPTDQTTESLPVSLPQTPSPTAVATATPTPDPYAGWHEQKFAGFGVVMKAPDGWNYKDSSSKITTDNPVWPEFLKDPSKEGAIKYSPAYSLKKADIEMDLNLPYGIDFCDGVIGDDTMTCVTKSYSFKFGSKTVECQRVLEIEKVNESKAPTTPALFDCEGVPTGKSSSWKEFRLMISKVTDKDVTPGGEVYKMLQSVTLI